MHVQNFITANDSRKIPLELDTCNGIAKNEIKNTNKQGQNTTRVMNVSHICAGTQI